MGKVSMESDHYLEVLEKTQKWDEKETPFKPTDLVSNSLGDIIGRCKCRAGVLIDENYYSNCGQRLNWEE